MLQPLLQTAPPRPDAPILADVDDVLLNWIEGFRVFCEDRLERSIDPSGPSSWEMGAWLGLDDPGAVHSLIDRFNAGEGGFFGRLPALPDAKVALERLRAQGRRLHVITSCSSDPRTVRQRTENLHAHFGDMFSEIECLDLGISKAPSLARHAAGIWVEDNHANGLAGADLGHRTFMLRRSHNRAKEASCLRADLTWVNCWNEIMAHCEMTPETEVVL